MKRQNIWNEDAWKNISKKDADLTDIQDIFKQKKRDFSAESFQNEQMRAEFADFNVDGLRKFHQSQKNPFHNPLLHAKREMDFSLPAEPANEASDFLNWDMNPAPQPQAKPPVFNEEFSNFDFGSAKKQPADTSDDFFSLGVPQPQILPQAAPQNASFWDVFGATAEETPHKPANPQPVSTGLPAEKVAAELSSQDQLLQLSLDPSEAARETPKAPEPEQPIAGPPKQAPEGPASFLDIELA